MLFGSSRFFRATQLSRAVLSNVVATSHLELCGQTQMYRPPLKYLGVLWHRLNTVISNELIFAQLPKVPGENKP